LKVFRNPRVPVGQLMLLPPDVDDLVSAGDRVRVVSEIIDQLDTRCLREARTGGGAPAYAPEMLLKVLVFGLTEGVRSSRVLERALQYDIRYMWMARMSRPSYGTLCRFRRTNEAAIVNLFAQTVLFAHELGLALLQHVAVDGTKLLSAGSRRGYRRLSEVEESLAGVGAEIVRLLAEMEARDATDEGGDGDDPSDGVPEALRDLQARKAQLERVRAEMQRQEVGALVPTDPDSRMMKTGDGRRPCYNGQVGVDGECQVIVSADVTQAASDNHELRPMLEQAERTLGEHPEQVLADGGYWSADSLDYVAEHGLDAYIPPSGTLGSLEGWTYDANSDTYRSPDGLVYVKHGIRRDLLRVYHIYRCRIDGKYAYKCVPSGYEQMDHMRGKVASPAGREARTKRMSIVEPVFGHIKGVMGLRRLLLRGLSGARIEFLLACIAHNVGKISLTWRPQPL
jgi:transposase